MALALDTTTASPRHGRPSSVMAGLVPAIHDLGLAGAAKSWMAGTLGTSPRTCTPGHDTGIERLTTRYTDEVTDA